MNNQEFGRKVASLRKDKKINQEELAKAADISRNYVSLIERGEADNVSVSVIEKLANALETTPAVLTDSTISRDVVIPDSLREFAMQNDLPFRHINALLSIPFRGKDPETADDWQSIYDAIKEFL